MSHHHLASDLNVTLGDTPESKKPLSHKPPTPRRIAFENSLPSHLAQRAETNHTAPAANIHSGPIAISVIREDGKAVPPTPNKAKRTPPG